MKPKHTKLTITLCGPGDVIREIGIAENVIDSWNRTSRTLTGCELACQHWNTHAVPDMKARGQEVINHQLIDKSDLVIAIFWARLGTPTGLADSGTVEEVQRAMARGIRVMLYFSDLAAPMQQGDEAQRAKVKDFRKRVMDTGFAWSFSSRLKFENELREHLGMVVAELLEKKTRVVPKKAARKSPSIRQSSSRNTQVVGDHNTIYASPHPPAKIVIGPAPGQVTAAEQTTILKWLDELAVLSAELMEKTLGERKAEWRSRLLKRFHAPRYNALMSEQMPEVEKWYRQAKGRFLRKPKAKKSRASAVGWKKSIKARMTAMGQTNEDYYPEIAVRLGLTKFTSLNELSPPDLERFYNLVGRDARPK